jgi:hypothetical protein
MVSQRLLVIRPAPIGSQAGKTCLVSPDGETEHALLAAAARNDTAALAAAPRVPTTTA